MKIGGRNFHENHMDFDVVQRSSNICFHEVLRCPILYPEMTRPNLHMFRNIHIQTHALEQDRGSHNINVISLLLWRKCALYLCLNYPVPLQYCCCVISAHYMLYTYVFQTRDSSITYHFHFPKNALIFGTEKCGDWKFAHTVYRSFADSGHVIEINYK